MEEVFLTTISTNNYLAGVLLLARYIKQYCSHRLVVLAKEGLADETYAAIQQAGAELITAPDMQGPQLCPEEIHGSIYSHWANTLFKLNIFSLVQFKKIVFVDSDMMLLGSLDELFECPDVSAVIAGKSYPGNEGFKDLNSGLMVLVPQQGLADAICGVAPRVAASKKFFGDQDVLSEYYTNWPQQDALHLPECYNVFFRHYQYYQKRGKVKVVHFIGKVKPWMMTPGQTVAECVKCLFKGNAKGIPLLLQYQKDAKAVGKNG